MKRWITVIAALSIVAIILGGCGNGGTGSVTSTPKTGKVNLVVAVEGKAQLKREGWNDYVPVGFGTLAYPTDLFNVEGKALMLCADLSVRPFSGLGKNPCPANQGWLEYGNMTFSTRQRGAPQDIPYILYPRNTIILEARPLLRWHATGVTSYTVSIVSGGKAIWSQSNVVSDTLRYPDDAPVLQPGIDYLLVVQDNATDRTSAEDPAKGLGFRLIGEADRKTIEQRRDEIMGLSALDEPARQLALAVYYSGLQIEGRGLWGEVWTLLESVAQARPAPAVHLRLGDVLAAMKLPDEAEAAYRAALQSAQALGDLESQAAACAGLWWVTGDAANRDKAIELYKQLGDERAIEALQ